MARIRSIKPEFWTSEQVVSCSFIARLLFIGMWTFCDDNGIHPASSKRLKLEIFPGDEISGTEIQAYVDELVRAGLLTEYQSGKVRYWQVTGWHKHQRIEKPNYKHPKPSIAPDLTIIPQPFADQSTTNRRPVDTHSTPEWSGVESSTLSDKSDCIAVLEYLNQKANRNYRPLPANLKLISARLKEGATVDECKSVIDARVAEWADDTKFKKYLRPETLFNATKFAGYVGDIGKRSEVPQWE